MQLDHGWWWCIAITVCIAITHCDHMLQMGFAIRLGLCSWDRAYAGGLRHLARRVAVAVLCQKVADEAHVSLQLMMS